jgi:PAS domain S-box-containing protein
MDSGEKDLSNNPGNISEHLRLANILDQMPVGIGIFDKSGSLFHSNRHFERAAGGAIPTIHSMGGAFWRAISPDGAAIDEQSYPGILALKGQVATPGIDFLRKTEEGKERWVGVSAVPLTVPGTAGVVGAVVVVEDIEERRRASDQLKAKEIRFRRFAEYSSNAIWIANVETGRIEYFSPAAFRIWSDHDGVETLAEWAETVHPDDRQRALESRRLVANGHVERFEYRIVDRDGAITRHVRETSFPIPGVQSEDDCIGGIVEDISPNVQIYLVQRPGIDGSDLVEELRRSARRIKTFSCQEDLMNVADVLNPGCVVVDMRGSDAAFLPLPQILKGRPADLQVIFVGSSETPASQVIDAMRAGAVDYILAPMPKGAVTRAVQKACEALPSRLEAIGNDRHELSQRLANLPQREREVLVDLISGGTNKTIARRLNLSPRTVEVHRAHLMERLNVRTLTELLQLAHKAGMSADAVKRMP